MAEEQNKHVEQASSCPFEARVWLDNTLVAVSSAALRVEQPDGTPMLCFPVRDVREELPSQGAELLLPSAPQGYVAFDHNHARVRVVLVDALVGEPERDHTHKRFPTWGDAAHLIDMLNVRPEAERSYVSVTRDN